MNHRLLVLVMAAALLGLRSVPAAAQATPASGKLDHLICYTVNDKLKPALTADLKAELQPEFSQAGCTVAKVTKFCVPVTKAILPPAPAPLGIVGQPLRDDYVCYQLKCPKNPVDIADKLVVDQFGQRPQKILRAFEVCAPARKASPPCFRIGTSKRCGGVCPNSTAGPGLACRFDELLQDCTCAPQECGGKPDKSGHCGGACPDPMQTCLPGLDAAGNKACLCQNPPTPPCGVNPATGTCGGTCVDPAAICVFVTTPNGVDCICQPPQPDCRRDAASGQCGGPCPPGLSCLLDPVVNDCRCEPQVPNCGPNPLTGQCGGICPPGTECRFTGTSAGAMSCGCVTP